MSQSAPLTTKDMLKCKLSDERTCASANVTTKRRVKMQS